ncbi:MAG: preprotein translocase subunit SecG [Bacteroidota bacterium]
MYAVLISVIILVAVLLVLVVLAQNSKGGGLSSQFGGAGAGQLMGVKKTTDLLEKLTWGLAITMVVLTLSTNFLLTPQNTGPVINSPNMERAQEQTIIPGFEGVGQDAPATEGTELPDLTGDEKPQ